jgi:hypothetical protein
MCIESKMIINIIEINEITIANVWLYNLPSNLTQARLSVEHESNFIL